MTLETFRLLQPTCFTVNYKSDNLFENFDLLLSEFKFLSSSTLNSKDNSLFKGYSLRLF